MKTWFVFLCTVFSLKLAAAPTEIQIFLDYHGPSKHGLKIISTPDNPVSAFYIYVKPGHRPTAAACYNGDPQMALMLFDEMVQVYNAEYNRRISTEGFPVINIVDHKIDLHIDGVDEHGDHFEWFDHMNVCDHWSTHSERWPTP